MKTPTCKHELSQQADAVMIRVHQSQYSMAARIISGICCSYRTFFLPKASAIAWITAHSLFMCMLLSWTDQPFLHARTCISDGMCWELEPRACVRLALRNKKLRNHKGTTRFWRHFLRLIYSSVILTRVTPVTNEFLSQHCYEYVAPTWPQICWAHSTFLLLHGKKVGLVLFGGMLNKILTVIRPQPRIWSDHGDHLLDMGGYEPSVSRYIISLLFCGCICVHAHFEPSLGVNKLLYTCIEKERRVSRICDSQAA